MIVFDSRNQVDETKDIKHQTLYYIIYRYVRCSEETEKHHIKNYRLERCLPNTGHTINKQLNPNTYYNHFCASQADASFSKLRQIINSDLKNEYVGKTQPWHGVQFVLCAGVEEITHASNDSNGS